MRIDIMAAQITSLFRITQHQFMVVIKRAALWSPYLMGLGIFITRVPSIYIPPFISTYLTSHLIARTCFLLIFFIGFVSFSKTKTPRVKAVFVLILIWLLFQSTSIIHAENIPSFIARYKDVVFGIIVFFGVYFMVSKQNAKIVVFSLVASATISLMFEITTYLAPHITFEYLRVLLHENYWLFFEYQFNRQRYFGDSFNEVVLPFVLFIFSTNKNIIVKFGMIFLVVLISFMVLVSNWRTKLLLYLFVLLISPFIYRRIVKGYFFLIVPLCGLVIILGNTISLSIEGSNVLDRVIFDSEIENQTVLSRFDYWKEAIDIGNIYPIFGVGLGNYFEYLSPSSQAAGMSKASPNARLFIAKDDPHNLFANTYATTGLLGLVSLCTMLLYFAYTDAQFFVRNNVLLSSTIMSFWVLVLFSMLNPANNLGFFSFYWALRGFIEKYKSKDMEGSG